jgi:hypothetical protein
MSGMLGTVLIAALIVVIALLRYRRLRRLRSYRSFRPRRLAVVIAVLCVVGTGLFLLPDAAPSWFAGALGLGVLLGLYAASRVEFDHGEHGLRFRSVSWVGTFVFALFTARIAWRLVEWLLSGRPPWARPPADPVASDAATVPITTTLLCLAVGYAVCHLAGIVIRARSLRAAGA